MVKLLSLGFWILLIAQGFILLFFNQQADATRISTFAFFLPRIPYAVYTDWLENTEQLRRHAASKCCV